MSKQFFSMTMILCLMFIFTAKVVSAALSLNATTLTSDGVLNLGTASNKVNITVNGTLEGYFDSTGFTVPSPPGFTGYFKILTADDGFESGTINMVGDYVEFGSSAENPPNPDLPHVRLKLGTDGSVGIGGDIAEGNFSQGLSGSTVVISQFKTFGLNAYHVNPPMFEIAGNLSMLSQGPNGMGLRITGATYTDTSAAGTVATGMVHSILTPTLAATNARTYTDASTLYIDSPPTAGTNVTITNPYAVYIASGNTFLNGNLKFGTSPTIDSTTSRLEKIGGTTMGTWNATGLGIGITPVLPLQVNGSVGFPATSGTSQVGGVRLSFTPSSSGVLDIGSDNHVGGGPWLQATQSTDLSVKNNLFLQPNGGRIAIGSAVFSQSLGVLTVDGGSISLIGAAGWGVNGAQYRGMGGNTYTDTTSAGVTAGPFVTNSFGASTFATSNAGVTYTNAATVYIAGPPAAGTNLTITNPAALYVAGGNSYFGGNVGILNTAPQSALQVGSTNNAAKEYLQIDSESGAPAAGDCDADAEKGRMIHDYTNNKLYICGGAARGWDHLDLID